MKKKFSIILIIIITLTLIVIVVPKIISVDKYSYKEAIKNAPGKFVEVNNKKVHYIVKGSGEAIICIHGFLYNTVMWEKNIDALSKKYKVYAIDLFGWGYSERLPLKEYGFKTYSKQVIGFMNAMNIKKASLIGQSMGGGTSTYTAAYNPDRINKLILIDTAVLPYKASFTAKIYRLPFIGEFFNALPGDGLMENNIRTMFFYNDEIITKKYLHKIIYPTKIAKTMDGAMHVLRNVLVDPMVEKEAKILAKLNIPILIIHGREDNEVLLERSETLNKLWKKSKLVIFEKARHSPHEEYPEKFNNLALDFLMKSH